MPRRVLQICSEANVGSIGKISEAIGEELLDHSWESYIAYGRMGRLSKSKTIKIGGQLSIMWHGLMTRFFDTHGLHSKAATRKLIRNIDEISPDLIHLHHLHGYYINHKILFNYLSKLDVPVIWTFHDCWSFTGHCAHFEFVNCNKWMVQCNNCPQKGAYPKSYFIDRSRKNYIEKKSIFNSVSNLTIVSPSYWLDHHVKSSFLKNHKSLVIRNGVDTKIFYPYTDDGVLRAKFGVENKFVILGVAGVWSEKKGLDYFDRLSEMLPDDCKIILVGLTKKQSKKISSKIVSILRTENVHELAKLYSIADVFANPTLEDTFPTTNLEALSCGCPIITFKTGGSVESVTEDTGFVINKGDLNGLYEKILTIKKIGRKKFEEACRAYALQNFEKNQNFNKYFKLYQATLENE